MLAELGPRHGEFLGSNQQFPEKDTSFSGGDRYWADQKNENLAIFDSVPYPLVELFARRDLRGARESAIYVDHIWSRDHSWSLSLLRECSSNEYVGKE
jgi:hypothetical protein